MEAKSNKEDSLFLHFFIMLFNKVEDIFGADQARIINGCEDACAILSSNSRSFEAADCI